MAILSETIDAVKGAIRITSAAMNPEIEGIIEACLLDLSISGLKNIVETDPLIKRAIIIYSKSHFGMNNDDSEKYMASYESLKNHMALCGDYKNVPVVVV